MLEKLRVALMIAVFVIGNVGFGAYLQTNPTLCENLAYPVCTGSPDEP